MKYSMFIVFRLSWLMSVGIVVLYFSFVQITKSEVGGGKEGKRETQGVRIPKSIPPSSNHLEYRGHMNSWYECTTGSDPRNLQYNSAHPDRGRKDNPLPVNILNSKQLQEIAPNCIHREILCPSITCSSPLTVEVK